MNNLSETVRATDDGAWTNGYPAPVPIPLAPRQSPGAWCRRAEPHSGPQRTWSTICSICTICWVPQGCSLSSLVGELGKVGT